MARLMSARTLAVIGCAGAVACTKDVRVLSGQKAAPGGRRIAAMSAANVPSPVGTGRHIVSFSAAAPGDFAAQVTALGGTVLWVSPSTGLAAVSGLQGSAPATLAGRKGIQAVDADQSVALVVPRVSGATRVASDAQVSSRGFVTAGVTSRTTLVAVKVCAYINACPFSSVLGGVIYAADHGADVINLSLGGAFSKAGNGRFVGLINKVFNYARSRGVTVVVAAGNEATDLNHDGNTYETYCSAPAVICVSATGPTAQASDFGPWTDVDAPGFYTNFGRSAIDVAAPGGNNDSFVWGACTQTSRIPALADCSQAPFFVVGADGTSLAAPHVSGAAALLVSVFGRHPSQVKARLQQSADAVAGNGTSPFYGKGRLNVGRAV